MTNTNSSPAISTLPELIKKVEDNKLELFQNKISIQKILLNNYSLINNLFTAALKKENQEMIDFLLNNIVDNKQDLSANNDELFQLATIYGNTYMLNFLLKEGVKINSRNDSGIQTSALNGDLKLVKFFISKGASITANDYAPLKNASSNNFLPVVQYLLEEGRHNLSHYNFALECSIRNKHLELTVYLLEERKKIETEPPYFFSKLVTEDLHFVEECQRIIFQKELDKELPIKETTKKQKI